MADSTSAVAGSPVSGEDLARAEKFTFEPFVHEGDHPAVVLAQATPRRRALDEALAELDSGRDQPSVAWRQKYSLMLGLERLMSQDEPKLADGTLLNPHQVDALSGTLIALISELPSSNGASLNGAGSNGAPPAAELDQGDLEDEDEDEDWDDDDSDSDDDGDSDWNGEGELDEDAQLPEQPEDPNATRRFWFEHATGAGKTVAAMGFVEASRTGGILILTHRRNLVDQFHGELRDRGYAKRISSALLGDKDRADGPVTVETYQWFVRNAGKISDAYTIVICDEAHTALGEKTSAAIRRWAGPVFIGMTATGALIAATSPTSSPPRRRASISRRLRGGG